MWNGDVSKWRRFCNTLRLRLALRISNIEPVKAKMEAEAALFTEFLMENNDHDGSMDITSWNGDPQNGMCRVNGWYQQIMSANMESYMVGYDDPRVGEFWQEVYFGEDVNDNGISGVLDNFPDKYKSADWLGTHRGIPNGLPQIYYLDEVRRSHSRYGTQWRGNRTGTQPIIVINAAETWFLKAEAALKGWSNTGGSVEYLYNKGIEVSMKQWVPNITEVRISEYIHSGKVPSSVDNDFTILPGLDAYSGYPVAMLPVKLSTNNDERFEQICIQKWLAVYPLATEAWAEVRRNRLPRLYPKLTSINPNISLNTGQIQTRAQFAESEKSANREQVIEAVKLLGKGDGLEKDIENVPLWWDVHPNGNVTSGTFSETGDIDWYPVSIWDRE
jgi:hypothetical protein